MIFSQMEPDFNKPRWITIKQSTHCNYFPLLGHPASLQAVVYSVFFSLPFILLFKKDCLLGLEVLLQATALKGERMLTQMDTFRGEERAMDRNEDFNTFLFKLGYYYSL